MRYAKLSCFKFYSCYLQQCLSIDLFSYRASGHDQKGHMDKVSQSFCPEVFLELALQIFLELNMLLGAHVVLSMTARFSEINFLTQKLGIQAKPRVLSMYRKVQFFMSILSFFLNLVCNESLYQCNCCMFEQISHLAKFWFLRYGPKLAVSHKQIIQWNKLVLGVPVQQFSEEWLIRFY